MPALATGIHQLIEYTAVRFHDAGWIQLSPCTFFAWRQRSLIVYLRDPESKAFVFHALVVASLVIAAFLLAHNVYPDWATSLRFALFNTVSIATTTGYANTDYNQWPIFAPVLMLFLSGFTTCAGSTGGGIKMIRALILLKQARREMTRILHPRAINPVCIGNKVIENNVIFAVLAFMLVYGGLDHLVDISAAAFRTGCDQRVQRVRRLHQQHRPRIESGRPSLQLRRAERLRDVGMHVCDADRPA